MGAPATGAAPSRLWSPIQPVQFISISSTRTSWRVSKSALGKNSQVLVGKHPDWKLGSSTRDALGKRSRLVALFQLVASRFRLTDDSPGTELRLTACLRCGGQSIFIGNRRSGDPPLREILLFTTPLADRAPHAGSPVLAVGRRGRRPPVVPVATRRAKRQPPHLRAHPAGSSPSSSSISGTNTSSMSSSFPSAGQRQFHCFALRNKILVPACVGFSVFVSVCWSLLPCLPMAPSRKPCTHLTVPDHGR